MYGSSLKLTSNYMGNGSKVSVLEGSTAYGTLFKRDGHSYIIHIFQIV